MLNVKLPVNKVKRTYLKLLHDICSAFWVMVNEYIINKYNSICMSVFPHKADDNI